MAQDFIPSQQDQRVNWLSAFNAAVQANLVSLNVPVSLTTALDTTLTTLLAAWAVVQDQATRTRPAINAKDQAMANCVAAARHVAAVIQAMPVSLVSDELRLELGLPVHDSENTPIPVPDHKPNIVDVAVSGRLISGRLTDASEPTNRGKPAGCAGAVIYSHIGDTEPASIDDWKMEGLTTRTKFSVLFPDDLPAGTKVWISAAWRNYTDELGPAADGIPQTLGAGNTQAA